MRLLPILNHCLGTLSNGEKRRFSNQQESFHTRSYHQGSTYLHAQNDGPLKTSAWSPSRPGKLSIHSLIANRILDIVPLREHPALIKPSLCPNTGTQPRSELSNPRSHHPHLVASRMAMHGGAPDALEAFTPSDSIRLGMQIQCTNWRTTAFQTQPFSPS